MTTDRTFPDFAPSTHFHEPRAERTNQGYRAQLLDEFGDPINPVAISQIFLTIWDDGYVSFPTDYVNSRNAQNIWTGGGTGEAAVDSDGWLTFSFKAADMAMRTGATEPDYLRRAHFRVVYAGGEVNHEITFIVRNLGGVS